MMYWDGKSILYWGKRVDTASIYHDNFKNATKFLINFFLLLIGAIGIILLLNNFLQLQKTLTPIWKFYQIRSWTMLAFWLSLVVDSYLFYRLQRGYEASKKVIKKKIKDQPPIDQAIDWETVTELSNT